MYAYIYALTQLGCLTSQLCITQTSYTCGAGDNYPAGALLCVWSRLCCLSLHFFFLSFSLFVYLPIFAALVTLAVAAEILHLLTALGILHIKNAYMHIFPYT